MHVYRQFIYFYNSGIIVAWDESRGRQFFGRPTIFEVATPGILTERGLFFFFFVFWVADLDTLPFPFFDSVLAKITDTSLVGVQSIANANESHSTILNQDALKKKTPSISRISSNLFNGMSPAQKISELNETNQTRWSDKWNSHDKQNS